MAFTTGFTAATNSTNDLLSLFRTWITVTIASPWTEEAWSSSGSLDTDVNELSIRGPGAGADREVFINLQSRNAGGDYGIAMTGATDYSSLVNWGQQQEESSEVFLNLINAIGGGIEYWFYANDRRFIIIAKISTSFLSCYGGFFLPFATPAEYPFPLFVGANYLELAAYNNSNVRNRSFCDPGFGAAYYKQRGVSTWRPVSNHGRYNSTSTANTLTIGDYASTPITPFPSVVWPFRVPPTWDGATGDWSSANHGFADFRPTEDDEAPLFQCHIVDSVVGVMPGALDGVFGAAAGGDRTADSTATDGGTTYRYFQNVGKSDHRDMFAIEEV